MPSQSFLSLFARPKPVIGMVHLLPLPGCARGNGDLAAAIERALADTRTLEAGGVDGLMIENFHDAPFRKDRVSPATIAAMTAAAIEVRRATRLPIGINVLRNDIISAISVAHVAGAQFVRCNVYIGAAVTDQGILEGAAEVAVRCRGELGAGVAILADVEVKHAAQLASRPLALQAKDAINRGCADGVVVSGEETGRATSQQALLEARSAIPSAALIVGSGLRQENAAELLEIADAAIAGVGFKQHGDASLPVDEARVRSLMEIVEEVRNRTMEQPRLC